MQKKIARVALQRMQQECETNFELLSGFGSDFTKGFLAWIGKIPKTQQLEAALSLTCRYLRLNRIECAAVPNYEYWVESFINFPLACRPFMEPRSSVCFHSEIRKVQHRSGSFFELKISRHWRGESSYDSRNQDGPRTQYESC